MNASTRLFLHVGSIFMWGTYLIADPHGERRLLAGVLLGVSIPSVIQALCEVLDEKFASKAGGAAK